MTIGLPVDTVLDMEVDYIILVSHEEFIVIHTRNEAPIGIYLERAEAAIISMGIEPSSNFLNSSVWL